MNRNDRTGEFWEHVNTALDERRDPYADPHVAATLARQPELLEPLAELLESLDAIASVRPVASPAREARRLGRIAAAVVLAAAGVAGWLALRAERTPQFTFEPGRGEVLALRAEFVRSEGAESRSTSLDALTGTRASRHVLAPVPKEIQSEVQSVLLLATQTFQFGVQR